MPTLEAGARATCLSRSCRVDDDRPGLRYTLHRPAATVAAACRRPLRRRRGGASTCRAWRTRSRHRTPHKTSAGTSAEAATVCASLKCRSEVVLRFAVCKARNKFLRRLEWRQPGSTMDSQLSVSTYSRLAARVVVKTF